MRLVRLAIAVSFVALTSRAHADFVVTSKQLTASSIAPAVPAVPDDIANGDGNAAQPTIVMPRFKVALGFGDRVPLRFAVRQIVPKTVRVTYGRGVNPDALVDWRGGDRWNRVLSRAVAPLRFRLIMTYMAVDIR